MTLTFIIWIVLLLLFIAGENQAELVVNVRNQFDVFQEKISANTTEDTIHLELQQPDGTILSEFIDFKNEVQIVNVITLGEEELQQQLFQDLNVPTKKRQLLQQSNNEFSQLYEILCFVTYFNKKDNSDFIPSDAMAKLRQKNPWAIRQAEKNMGRQNLTFNVLLDITSTDWISPYIFQHCSDAKDSTYSIKADMELIYKTKQKFFNHSTNMDDANMLLHEENYLRSVKPFDISGEEPSCASSNFDSKQSNTKSSSCVCKQEFCIAWYPCALKYCRSNVPPHPSDNPEDEQNVRSYRCGIHTCRVCRQYTYLTHNVFANFYCQ